MSKKPRKSDDKQPKADGRKERTQGSKNTEARRTPKPKPPHQSGENIEAKPKAKPKPKPSPTSQPKNAGKDRVVRGEIGPASRTSPGHGDPHEAVRHVLGPKEPTDGRPTDADEEARRQRALMIDAERLAKEYGLDVRPTSTYTPDERPTERAKDIKQLAEPEMDKAADEIKFARTKMTIRDAQGRSIEFRKTELHARNLLKHSVETIAELVAAPFQWTASVTIRIGKWLNAKVGGGGESD